ncbi:hypothetical protein [Methylobacterium sp. sgz302541]|uniref:hypothetical protein n=1 Tax=unclassified Methylobacterium TaxID=2615210 RepID=UPI003D326E94
MGKGVGEGDARLDGGIAGQTAELAGVAEPADQNWSAKTVPDTVRPLRLPQRLSVPLSSRMGAGVFTVKPDRGRTLASGDEGERI